MIKGISSVAQPCPPLCDTMDCSTPGFPVHHQLLESTPTHAHWVGDAIQPSHPLSSPSPPTFSSHLQSFPYHIFSYLSSLLSVSPLKMYNSGKLKNHICFAYSYPQYLNQWIWFQIFLQILLEWMKSKSEAHRYQNKGVIVMMWN